MNKDLERVINLPKGTITKIEDGVLTLTLSGKESVKKLVLNKVILKVDNEKIILIAKNATRRESKIIGTTWAHINNMVKGLSDPFVYEMEICNVHFPMNVKVQDDKLIIKSFLGETTERLAKILPGVNVDIKGSFITISSIDKDYAGQTAANIEKATRLTGRDKRIFQDGIFITKKCGKGI